MRRPRPCPRQPLTLTDKDIYGQSTVPTPRRPSQHVPTSTLATRINELVQACFTGLWIESHEPDEAIRDLTQLARRESWRLGIWDCDSGLTFPFADARDFEQIQAAVGDLLVDRPRRNILRRGGVAGAA